MLLVDNYWAKQLVLKFKVWFHFHQLPSGLDNQMATRATRLDVAHAGLSPPGTLVAPAAPRWVGTTVAKSF